MKNIVGLTIIVSMMLCSCAVSDKYYIHSPNHINKILVFEWITSYNPGKKWYVKIYPKGMPKNYVAIRPIMDLPIHVFWGDTVKVRGGVWVDGDTLNGIIGWKRDYDKTEAKDVLKDTINWKHYYLNLIPKGAYK